MTCGWCNHDFDEAASKDACTSCGYFGGCRKVRCPRCGMEMPEEPAFVRKLRAWRKNRAERRAANV